MKNIILTMVVVLTATFANAQDKKSSGNSEMKFGVKGGLNFSNLTGDGDPSMKVGILIGGFMEYKVSEKFAIQPELLYSTQGAKFEFSEYDGLFLYTDKYDYQLSYLNIPIMAKYYISEKFSIEAGPQFGFLLSANQDYTYIETDGFDTTLESSSTDIKKYLNSMDYGLNLGAAYNINKNMVLGLRYNIGLNDIEKNLVPGFSGHKNKVFQLSFGYKF